MALCAAVLVGNEVGFATKDWTAVEADEIFE